MKCLLTRNSPPIACLVYALVLLVLTTNGASAVKGSWTRNAEKSLAGKIVRGGQEGTDPSPTYICRAQHSSALIPGKFVPEQETCYSALERSELTSTTFELLETGGSDSRYKWVEGTGIIGENAVEGGHTDGGKALFICRTHKVDVSKWFWSGKAELVGNTARGWNRCVAPWWGGSRGYDNYDILIDTRARLQAAGTGSADGGPSVPCKRTTEEVHRLENDGASEYRETISTNTGASNSQSNTNSNSNSDSSGHSAGASAGAGYGSFSAMANYNYQNSKSGTTQQGQSNEATRQQNLMSSMDIVIPAWHVRSITQEFEVCGQNKRAIGFRRISVLPLPGYEERINAQVIYQKKLESISAKNS